MNKGNVKVDQGKIDFLGKTKLFVSLSVIVMIASLAAIIANGFNYGIDFSGGTEVQVQFEKPVDAGKVRSFTSEMGYKNAGVQSIGDQNEFSIR